MTKTTTLTLLAVAAISAAGCRSDGGIDRKDCSRGMAFCTRAVMNQARDDWEATRKALASAPHELAESFPKSARTISNTWSLYLEGHETR